MASIDVNTPAGNIEVAPRIRHHCIVSKLMDVNKSLSEECKSQLQTTPFGWLLNLHCNIETSGRMLEVMATSWNADARAFQVGDRLISFTLYDIALILGHLKTTSPERTQLVTLLTKPSIQVPNRVRLYIVLVFSYFLFPTTSKKVNPSLLPLLDDRANLGTYAWGKAVYDFLVSGLSRAASSMQAKKGRGNLHIQGCTALLQVLSVLVAMPWEQEFNVLPIQTPIADLPSLPSKAVKRGKTVKRVKAAKKKAKVAMVDLASSPSKRDNAGEAAAAVVDLVSSPSKGATSVRYTRAKTRAHKNLMIVAPQSEPVRNEWVDAHFLYQPTVADEAVLADFRKKWGGATRRATRRRPNEVDSNEVAISTETYELAGREVSSLLGDRPQDDGSRWISTAVVDTFKDVLMQKLTESGHPPPYINFIISVHGGTTILGMSQSTSTQRGKRTRKGKQPIQDDQPQPQSVFRPSWVRSMPGNCNRIFVPVCHSGHFVMLVVDCLEKVFYFFYSLPSATHRALAPTLRKALEQICIENLGHKDVHTWLLEYKNDIPKQDNYA
uniref:Aminotransferase-like plant mobile domain-containing protein n=1 Tax=Fagus sylvatica TaxID=28930 RepID=A0A2N9IRE3_FAGSY